MLTYIQRKCFSLAREALRSKKVAVDKTDFIVSSDFYRVDIGFLVFRPSIHMRLDDIEKQNLLLEYELMIKEEQAPPIDQSLLDISLNLPTRITNKEDLWSTEYKQLEGEERAKQIEIDKERDAMYGDIHRVRRRDVDAEGKNFINLNYIFIYIYYTFLIFK